MTTVLRIAAFSDGNKGGNPAGVRIGDVLPDASTMQAIAADVGDGTFHGRCVTSLAVTSVARSASRRQATSSVQTLKLTSVFGPKVWVIGTSAASRPCAIRIRPILGTLLRGSKVCQRPPR